MTIKHLAHRIAHKFGIASLAENMGLDTQILRNKLNVNSDSHHLYIEELSLLSAFTNGDLEVAGFFAERSGAVVIVLPEMSDGQSDIELLDAGHKAAIGYGKSAYEKSAALEDGKIDKREMEAIRHANRILICAILSEEARYESLVD